MFTKTELESMLLGAQWVSQYGDAPLSEGAKEALNKIFDVLPASIKNENNAFTLRVGPPAPEKMAKENLSTIRDAIAKQNKIELVYKSQDRKETQRVIWPFTIGYFTDERILVAWCEKDNDYRHFKTDRIISLKVLDEHYLLSKDSLFRGWQRMQLQKLALKRK